MYSIVYDMSTSEERILEICNKMFAGNKSALARAIDMKPAALMSYMSSKRNIGRITAERFRQIDVNPDWILTGEGSKMLGTLSEKMDQLKTLTTEFMDSPEVPVDLKEDIYHLIKVHYEYHKAKEQVKKQEAS